MAAQAMCNLMIRRSLSAFNSPCVLRDQDCSVGLERREHVQVKGRGTMTTYFLVRAPKPAA